MVAFPKKQIKKLNKPNLSKDQRDFTYELNKIPASKHDWAIVYLNEGWDGYVQGESSDEPCYSQEQEKAVLWLFGYTSAIRYFNGYK